jgi:hypothetical protein
MFDSFIKKHKLFTGIATIIVLLFVGVAITLAMSDGTEKFHNIEKKAAEQVLEEFPNLYHEYSPRLYALKIRIEGVEPMNSPGAKPVCTSSGKEREEYWVKVSLRTVFGLTYDELVQPSWVCP